MSLHPQDPPSIPEETSRVAHAAFPKGTPYLLIADALGAIYKDSQFAALFPRRGQPAEAPGRLALATVLQYMEGLSDRQAADAVRGRIDWKYALGLPLTDPGFDHTVLSEFRSRLIEGKAERLLLDTLLRDLRERDLIKARGRQRTRLYARVGRCAQTQQAGTCRRNLACDAERACGDSAGLAASIGARRLVRTVWPTRRELQLAQDRCRAT